MPSRPKTLSRREFARLPIFQQPDLPTDHWRPITRGDCADVPRPCPYVACRHHLLLDFDEVHGSVKINFPDVDLETLEGLVESCSLDVADMGEMTPTQVAPYMNFQSRERVRQISNAVRDKADMRLRELGVEETITWNNTPNGDR